MDLWRKVTRGVAARARGRWHKTATGAESRAWVFWARLLGAEVGQKTALIPASVAGEWRWLRIEDEAALGRCHLLLLAPVHIGHRAILNDGVRVLSGSHDVNDPQFPLRTAPVTIGDYAWVATNAMILPGVTVGERAVVAAGAVVTRDVAPGDIVGGNPAKIIGKRSLEQPRYRPGLVEYLFPKRTP